MFGAKAEIPNRAVIACPSLRQVGCVLCTKITLSLSEIYYVNQVCLLFEHCCGAWNAPYVGLDSAIKCI